MYIRYGLGDAPNCNTAGGYSRVRPSCWMLDQCMLPAEFAAAEAACHGSAAPGGGSSGSSGSGTTSTGSSSGSGPGAGTSGSGTAGAVKAAVPSSSLLDTAVDWVKENPLLAAVIGVGVVLLVTR